MSLKFLDKKILIIGYGSMGRRHSYNLLEFLGDSVRIDILRRKSSVAESDNGSDMRIRFLYSDNQLEESYDAVFVTNPTSLHYETLNKYLYLSNSFFIEKPVFVTGEEDIVSLVNENKLFYVACPLRYSNVIQWLKRNIDFSVVHSMRVMSSSYLPDWRPGTDYRNTYSAHKEMGGGVSIDLIHEWDYISYLAGFPKAVKSIIERKSNLEIDSDDIAVYVAEYENMLVEVHLDYFGRKAIRRVELFAEDDTIVADLINQKIEWLCSGKVVDLSEERNSYQKKELEHFIDIIEGNSSNDNGIEEACKVLRITRGVL
ncbi:Gfo/Idh/MocA family protein [Butyrivibrio sp. LB2008]|uniref:Gfo/Idh/MocA family protein n=1 Tax=Butyrivibrio sp. LB2008 TaxID=1408305 RepID=UPI0005633C94|nr:Gfo/Idh/MocA family oxidoreductase [Butyrivibrio sp. LB2008]